MEEIKEVKKMETNDEEKNKKVEANNASSKEPKKATVEKKQTTGNKTKKDDKEKVEGTKSKGTANKTTTKSTTNKSKTKKATNTRETIKKETTTSKAVDNKETDTKKAEIKKTTTKNNTSTKTTTSKAKNTGNKTSKKISNKEENPKEQPKQTKKKKEVETKIKKEDVEKKLDKEEKTVVNDEQIQEQAVKSNEQKTTEENVVKEEDNINPKENEEIKPKKRHTKAFVIVFMLLLIAIMIFSTIFALMNKVSDRIIYGVSIEGIDVSGLTIEQATDKINDAFGEQWKKDITLEHADFETAITPEQIEMNFNIDEAVSLAYNIGRTGSILKDNYSIINAGINKQDINVGYSYNEEALTNFIISTEGNLPDLVKQSSYSIDGTNLIIDKGERGVCIEEEDLKKQIIRECTILGEGTVIQISTIEKEPDAIDLNKIRNEIYKEPQDAYYTKEPFTVYPHVNGVDFGISMEEAINLLNSSEDQTITIPLKITEPSVTTNQIGTEAFPNLLSTFSTTFSTSNTNRTTNIKLASNKINGVVLMPGEEFSYNTVVGPRTAQAGYKSAAVYVNGKVENGIGGGICQVSSTLYNTALRANLEIIQRSNHRFATGYVPLSTDATVSWGGPEFIFKNSRNHPIKIESQVSGGKITVSIYGCKEDVEYEVVIQSQTLQTIPMQTEYRINTSLPQGTTKTVQKGHGGYKSRAYRILKLNGEIVSKELLSTDTYAQLPTIIEQNP